MTKTYGCKTLDPRNPTGPKIDAIIFGDLVLRCYKYLPVRYENFRAVKEVLEHPSRIFGGVRPINPGGWCYVGRPATWCVAEDIFVPFPADKVFAVYLNDRMFVYNFRAEKVDPGDIASPRGWRQRFAKLTWKSTS